MRHMAFIYPLAALLTVLLGAPAVAIAQDNTAAQHIVVLVNGEPITTYDIAQRMRWNNRTSNFGEKMKAQLTGDAINQKFRQMLIAAQPHSQAEALAAAERIKKQLIEDAKRQVLSENGGAGKKAAIDSLIDDKLKLQEAKRLGIDIVESEVEEALAARAGTGADGKKPDMNAFYAQFEKDGISRKTIQEVIRTQLAWRDVIRRICRPGATEVFPYDCNTYPPIYLEELRHKAAIDYGG